MRRLLSAVACGALLAGPAHAVTIDWVVVGDPGNACDTQPQGCFGAVPDTYRISKYEITNAQYTEFLNAVAATDPNALYNTLMGGGGSGLGGITRSGTSGSFTYSTIAGRENMPVVFVSWYDAVRFANWMNNGQPLGSQDTTTTEDGAYTITDQGITDNSIVRNAAATIFLTSEDEWYKAAYYDAISTSYYDFPTASDVAPTCAEPGATPNTANCGLVVGDLTTAGSYTGSPSPSGTFDQGGNAQEWNEAVISVLGRGIRGGYFSGGPGGAVSRMANDPSLEQGGLGFRLATVPEPGTALLVLTGFAALAWWVRREGWHVGSERQLTRRCAYRAPEM